MTPPASPARALHDLLTTVNREAQEKNVLGAWSKVAHASHNTHQFAQFHAEVGRLLGAVIDCVGELPATAQERYRRYFPAWWRAVVQPEQAWQNLKAAVIAASDLDMLGSLADLVEGRAQFVSEHTPNAVEVLQQAMSYLVAEVEKDSTLPGPVRDSVLADLRHVLWLLDNVDTFGLDHVVVATERVAGETLSAATKFSLPKLSQVGAGVLTVLAMVAGGTQSLDTAVTNVKHTLGISQEATPASADDDPVRVTIDLVAEMCSPPKGLAPGKSAQEDSDVLEGEVVDAGSAG